MKVLVDELLQELRRRHPSAISATLETQTYTQSMVARVLLASLWWFRRATISGDLEWGTECIPCFSVVRPISSPVLFFAIFYTLTLVLAGFHLIGSLRLNITEFRRHGSLIASSRIMRRLESR